MLETRGSDPLRRTRPERSVGHGFIFRSPDSIGSGAGQTQTRPDPWTAVRYIHGLFPSLSPISSLLTTHQNKTIPHSSSALVVFYYIYITVYTINIKNQNIELKPRTQKPIPHKERERERERVSNSQTLNPNGRMHERVYEKASLVVHQHIQTHHDPRGAGANDGHSGLRGSSSNSSFVAFQRLPRGMEGVRVLRRRFTALSGDNTA